MTDQEALNRFVELHPWEWKVGDWVIALDGGNVIIIDFDEFFDGDDLPWLIYPRRKAQRATTDLVGFRVLAGLWIEGRLREMGGEAFLRLEKWGSIWRCHYYIFIDDLVHREEFVNGDTPIQALLAALEETLPEVKYEP